MTRWGATADWVAPGCDAVRRLIAAYVDDTLEPSVRRPVSAHLSLCAPCLERAVHAVRFEKALHRWFSTWPSSNPAFWGRCEAALRDPKREA